MTDPKTVLIVDDQKPVFFAMKEAGLWSNYGLGLERDEDDPRCIISLCRNGEDALDLIRHSERFDVWLIDGDLGMGEGGPELFNRACEMYPAKVAEEVRSCSANPFGVTTMNRLVERWKAKQAKA